MPCFECNRCGAVYPMSIHQPLVTNGRLEECYCNGKLLIVPCEVESHRPETDGPWDEAAIANWEQEQERRTERLKRLKDFTYVTDLMHKPNVINLTGGLDEASTSP